MRPARERPCALQPEPQNRGHRRKRRDAVPIAQRVLLAAAREDLVHRVRGEQVRKQTAAKRQQRDEHRSAR